MYRLSGCSIASPATSRWAATLTMPIRPCMPHINMRTVSTTSAFNQHLFTRSHTALTGMLGKPTAACIHNRLGTQHSQFAHLFSRFQSTIPAHLHRPLTSAPTSAHYIKPSPHDRQLGTWLFVVAGIIVGMVTLGGVTRLTRSGLSMTEWKLHDVRPPLNDLEWHVEFDKYKQTPEYHQCNRDMTLSEFKRIYLYEYSHRVVGRLIGVVFAVPLLYFIARRRINGPLALRLSGLFVLGGAQGAIGWWMVKSGLNDWGYAKQTGVNQTPRVSPYRLATHLLSAFVIYLLTLKTALNLSYPVSSATAASIPPRLRTATLAVAAVIFVTVFSGAFVAGNQAGLIYNEFPYMGKYLVPYDDLWIVDIDPQWRNWFENSALVQFDHRVMAMTTVTAVLALWTYSKRFALPSSTRVLINALLAATGAQLGLGVATLLYHVPVSLGAAHQFTALMLLSAITATKHSMGTAAQARIASAAGNAVKSPPVTQMMPQTATARQFSTYVQRVQPLSNLKVPRSQTARSAHASMYTSKRHMSSTPSSTPPPPPNTPIVTQPAQPQTQQSAPQQKHIDDSSMSGPMFAVVVFAFILAYQTTFSPSASEQELARTKERAPPKRSQVQIKPME